MTRYLTALMLACLFADALRAETPTTSTAAQGTLIFSDDFTSVEIGSAWKITHPTFAIVDGALQGTQTKPTHGAVAQINVGQKDVAVEFRFQLNGATSVNAVLDDDDFKEGHGGHICRASLKPTQIFLGDDKERLHHSIEAMRKDPSRKAEADKLTAGRSLTIPTTFAPKQWYRLRMQVIGDELSVSIDGKPLGQLKSSGIAHPIKTTFHFTVSGSDALFDDVRVWKIDPQ